MDASKELQALWTVVFGEPPFIRADADVMAQVLVASLPPAPPYEPEGTPTSVQGHEVTSAFTSGPRDDMGRTCVS